MKIPFLFALLGLVAWITATFGPAIIAVIFWRLAGRVRQSWLVHALFVPCSVLLEWAAVWLVFFANHDEGDGPPGLGIALIPAFLLLALSLFGYSLALGIAQIKRLRHRT